MNRSNWMWFLLLILSILAGSVWATDAIAAGPNLSADLKAEQSTYIAYAGVKLRLSLTNSGDESAFILKWQIPYWGEIEADLFEVERDATPVRYIGKLIKRAAPQPDEFVEIAPGETLTETFDLSTLYDMSRQGEYTVRFRGRLDELYSAWGDVESRTRSGALKQAGVEIGSNAISFYAEVQSRPLNDASTRSVGGFRSCNATRVDTLRSSHRNAQALASKSTEWLATNPDRRALYTRWFGAYVSGRYATVKSHFKRIHSAFANQSVTYDCSCTDDWYAYVYPDEPYKIYLCSAFWDAPRLGTDSKAGTLVHEMSHFYATASTDDSVYGQTAALRLARNKPNTAVYNADNHEYFAESQP